MRGVLLASNITSRTRMQACRPCIGRGRGGGGCAAPPHVWPRTQCMASAHPHPHPPPPPTDDDNDAVLFEKIKKGNYDADDPIWENISPEAKDVVAKLLTVDSGKRLTAEQAMHHPWVQGKTPTTSDEGEEGPPAWPHRTRCLGAGLRIRARRCLLARQRIG